MRAKPRKGAGGELVTGSAVKKVMPHAMQAALHGKAIRSSHFRFSAPYDKASRQDMRIAVQPDPAGPGHGSSMHLRLL